jgi:hypothetical protein
MRGRAASREALVHCPPIKIMIPRQTGDTAAALSRIHAIAANLLADGPLARISFEPWPDEEAERFPVVALCSAPLARAEAVAALRTLLDLEQTTGLCPLLLAPGVDDWLSPWPLDDQAARHERAGLLERAELHAGAPGAASRFFADRAGELDASPDASLERAMSWLLARLGPDPTSRLARLDAATLDSLVSLEDEPDEADALLADCEQEEESQEQEAPFPGGVTLRLYRPPTTRTAAFDELAAVGGRSRVLLLACPASMAPLHVGFGDVNACPSPAQHAIAWSHWAARHGARPVAIGEATIAALVDRPACSPEALLRLAKEHLLYDADAGNEGSLALLVRLAGSHHWAFWWD